MNEEEKIARGKELLIELTQIIDELPDSSIVELLGKGELNRLLNAILDPDQVSDYKSIAEYFLANKWRATLLALMRLAITNNYSFKAKTKEGAEGFASPFHDQWFEDGVMILEGPSPFSGFYGLYKQGRMLYGVANRDIAPGENMGKDDFAFIDISEAKEVQAQIPAAKIARIEEPIDKINKLIESQNNSEAQYQQILKEYPWILGLEYRTIQSHENLDDENIPDLTAVRVVDGCRDIFELKPPFLSLFRANGDFSEAFNSAWNQAERYLDFARQEQDYLRRKGLRFDNPKCILIIGYALVETQLRKIRRKQRMNPAIQILTFNDLLVFAKSTLDLIRSLRNEAFL